MDLTRMILVTGATGRQGGAVARYLLKSGWQVRALVRDPNKPAARDLALQGVEIAQGDLDEPEGVRKAMEGCYGVFSVQSLETGVEGEIRQGRMMGDLAKEADVQHFVYSSVGSADRETGIPHFDSKFQIEEHLKGLELPVTILRPVFFYDNFSSPPFKESILSGTLALPMRPDRSLQMIAVEDIGGLAALAFNRPGQFIGKAMDIAGDEMSMPLAAEILSSVVGKDVRFVEVPLSEAEKQSPEMAKMFQWFNEVGYNANIRSLRDIYPSLMSFETWLRMTGWEWFARRAA